MATVNQIMSGFNRQMAILNHKISYFFRFISNKLKNFKNITLGEQISYGSVGAGLLLILTSIVLFIL